MNGDSPSVQPQRGGDLQHLLAHPAEAPALPGLPLQQAAQAMQDLVGVEAEQQAHLVAGHHVLNGGGAGSVDERCTSSADFTSPMCASALPRLR